MLSGDRYRCFVSLHHLGLISSVAGSEVRIRSSEVRKDYIRDIEIKTHGGSNALISYCTFESQVDHET